ncbi:MAG: class I mannose-6-phosphate isomerase [Coriobacteriia bacterium]|nr:class I mannose-6-phosphate isomerase [Coriobacteriia bacterium]
MNPIFLKPVHIDLIWGTEDWLISSHPHGDCKVIGTDKRLSELYPNFPLLIKIIKANDDLSVQVHPDEKSECWYIDDCEEGADIVIGHKAKSKEEFIKLKDENKWDDILNIIPIHPGDFFQIDPGTVHAIRGGTKIVEIQQTSDETYRIYDYGRPRELHIEKALDVIDFSNKEHKPINFKDVDKARMIKNDRYTVDLMTIKGKTTYTPESDITCISVLSGEGSVNDTKIGADQSFIITDKVEFEGNLKLIISHT